MVLVDTSIWIDHLRKGNLRLAALLEDEQILCHAFIVGEVACGRLRNRDEILALLHALPQAPRVSDNEVLAFIKRRRLMGRGLGLIDVHLLAAAALAGVPIWTGDRALREAAKELGVTEDV